MILLLLLASTEVDVVQRETPAAAVVPTQPMGTRGARPLVTGAAFSARAVGALLDSPLGLVGIDAMGALAVTNNLDLFGGARASLSRDNTALGQANVIPYIGARYGGSFGGRTFFGIELQVSAAFSSPRLSSVQWVIEPAALVSFTPASWLELTAGIHGLSAPQTNLWGVGPGFGSAFRVSPAWSLLVEMKTLVVHTPQNAVSLAPTLALGAAFH